MWYELQSGTHGFPGEEGEKKKYTTVNHTKLRVQNDSKTHHDIEHTF